MLTGIIIAALLVIPFGAIIAMEGVVANALLLQVFQLTPRRWVSAVVAGIVSLLMIAMTAWFMQGASIIWPNAIAEATSLVLTSMAVAWRYAFWMTDTVLPPDRGDDK